MKGERLGEFEELTLLTVLGLQAEAYGVTVQRHLEQETRRAISIGAVYAALDRLEAKGFVTSRVGGQTAERGGRSRRIFDVTPGGRRALKDMRDVRERMWRWAGARANASRTR